MKKSLLVTGVTGFAGRHLQNYLSAKQDCWDLINLPASFDLNNLASLHDSLHKVPDAVIHLAAKSNIPESFSDPYTTYQTNFFGTLNLLQALKSKGFKGTFLYISSGDVYGLVCQDKLPIDENTHPQPRNPYAVSKLACEHLCLQWARTENWRVIIARPFNHIGPKQSERFVIADLAQQFWRIEKGLQAPIIVAGDTEVSRDFLDVRDVISAYFALLDNGRSGEIYNICSGHEFVINDIICALADLCQISVALSQDPKRLRQTEQRRVCGSAHKIQQETGWKPQYTITTTLESIIKDLRSEAYL